MTEVECRDKKKHLSDFSKKCSKVLCKPQFVFLLTFITLHNEPWFSMDMLSNWCQIEGDTAILTYFAFCVWRINEIFSINYWSMGFIVGNKILLSPSRPMPLRSAQNPHNCWVFETIYHSSCVLFDRPLHSKSCIKIVVVCRHIFLRKSVSAPKCQKLDKFSMKRTGTL